MIRSRFSKRLLVEWVLARPCYACARVSHFPFGPGRLQKSWAGLSGEGAARANVSWESPTVFGTFVLLQDSVAIADRPHPQVRIRARIRRDYIGAQFTKCRTRLRLRFRRARGFQETYPRNRQLNLAADRIKSVRQPDLLSSVLHILGQRAQAENEAQSKHRNRCAHLQKLANPSGRRQSGGADGWAWSAGEKWGTRPSSPETDRKRSRKSPRPYSPRWRQKFPPGSPSFAGSCEQRTLTSGKVRQRAEKTFSHPIDSGIKPAA